MMRTADGSKLAPEIPTPATAMQRNRTAVAVVSVFAVVLGLVAAFAPSWLLMVDRPVSEWVRDLGFHRFFLGVTQIGAMGAAVVLGVVGSVLLWGRCRAFAYTVPIVIAGGFATDIAIKLIVARPRPPQPLIGTGLSSFPSGHVILTAIVLGLLPPVVLIVTGSRRWFRIAISAMAVGVPLVAVSRINLGAHWPSDVLASVFIGAALLLAAEYVAGSVWHHREAGGCALHPPTRR